MTNKKKFWKLCPFKKGDVLKVSKRISAKRAQFNKGEILIFITSDMSQYNGMTAYTFKSETGDHKIFDMADRDGIDKLTDLFHATEDKPKPKKSFSLLTVLIIVAIIGVFLKLIIQFEYLKESLITAPLYALGAFVLGGLAYYIKEKLTR